MDDFGLESTEYKTIAGANQYGSYAVPASSAHRPAAKAILSSRVWERRTIEFMTENAGGGDIVHAGAFFGDFLPALSASIQPGAFVWAFEPNPENYYCAQKTLELNALKNVNLRRAGLGNRSATGKLLVAARGASLGGASRIVSYELAREGDELSEVEIVRIDEAIPDDRKVSIIQLDLEGFEYVALKGAMELVRRCSPVVIVEDNKPILKCEELLKSVKYKRAGKIEANIIFTP